MVKPINALREITYKDLQFDQVPITMHSSSGTKYIRWVDVGMPRISPEALDCVFYLYKTKRDAQEGKGYGGTGFIVGVPSVKFPNQFHCYGVTNHHVALSDGFSVIRLNKLDGTNDIFEFEPIEWEFFPYADDIAISPQLPLNPDVHKVVGIKIDNFVTDNYLTECDIGIGDDVFMPGRFVNHDGGVTNTPMVRFGNISMMPTPIEQINGVKVKSYCVDIHSRTGYSGSPVFVYRTITGNLDELYHSNKPFASKYGFILLLGIHWGQFPEDWKIKEIKLKGKVAKERQLLIDEGYVKGLSGLTCVIPAQRILDLLNIPQLVEKRAKGDKKLERYYQQHGFPPESESEQPIIGSENPQHKEDFNSLVGAAAKKKPQDD